MKVTIPLPLVFRDLFECLNAEGVLYIMVGGWAVNSYGYFRSTNDLDVWVAPDADNIERMVNAAFRFGVTELAEKCAGLVDESQIVTMGREPMRLDIMSSIDGVTFEEAYARASMFDFEGLVVPVLSVEDLITNKETSDRLKDRPDVARLKRRLARIQSRTKE